ncbi:multisubstrate pseudouridine synthase 7 [Canna indica]|uniref:Multisubstrate pseudouridine synthase 7 n=1 Tax=Canna indica TaxID=4628 RepID=A0AAQ3K1P6_9LILI|nr:multisubstrate pseudouridine synthase 7 [Canna indica]
MAKSLDESDAGISCFVSSLPGFRGILKQRFTDFIVNEVDTDGNTVRLTSFDIPPEEPEDNAEENRSASDKDYTSEIESFRLLCGEVDADALKAFLESVLSSESDVPPILLSPDPDKSHRAEVHNFFKKNFKFLVTDTVEESEGSSKRVRVRSWSGKGGRQDKRGMKRKDPRDGQVYDSRGTDSWPENLGKFLRFNLYKENKDTQEALGIVGKMLGVQQRSFGFAGTKDKRSVSTQRVTMFKQHAKRLAGLNRSLFGIRVGDFCYVKEGLVLGQLSGNRFTITLRDVVADCEDTIKAAAYGLQRNGFVNYYGLQRFGSSSVPTHLVGAALLRGEWKLATNLILDPKEGERPFIREAREYYKEHGDVDSTLKKLPRHLVAEKAILQCLKKFPGNYLQALKGIPRTLRMMYVHSYQSYLWNHAASTRVQKYGISQVVLGDLVFCKETSPAEVSSSGISEHEDDCNERDNCLLDLSDEVQSEENVQSVKVVDSEDLLKGLYTFEDVVLPLPGSRILYPANDVASVYHDLAEKDGINLTESVHGAKEFSISCMKGAYRRVFQRPQDFVWELVDYTDDNIPLVETDLDIMKKAADSSKEVHVDKISSSLTKNFGPELSAGKHLGNEDLLPAVDPDHKSDILSPKLALKLTFTLPTSCYATMAIRELLKSSTSVSYHKALNH